MATEHPHKLLLSVPAHIGTKDDIHKGMKSLAAKMPDNIEIVGGDVVIKNVNRKVVNDIVDHMIADKIKFTEQFEFSLAIALGHACSKGLLTVLLSESEPAGQEFVHQWDSGAKSDESSTDS